MNRFVTVTLPPVSVTLFDASVENVPAADVASPIVTLSIEPPSKSTDVDVSEAPEIAPPVICAEPVVIVVNVPAADVVAPITTLSIAEPLAPSTSNVPSTSSVLPVPTVMFEVAISAPSMLPPLMSAESVFIDVNVAAADADAPIAVPSIAPPSISTVPDDSVLIVIALIVPPSTLSPEILVVC